MSALEDGLSHLRARFAQDLLIAHELIDQLREAATEEDVAKQTGLLMISVVHAVAKLESRIINLQEWAEAQNRTDKGTPPARRDV